MREEERKGEEEKRRAREKGRRGESAGGLWRYIKQDF
jgi:hypothetical protein